MRSRVELPASPSSAGLNSAGSKKALSTLHLPELDGVRATAIWMVLVSHLLFGNPRPAGSLSWMPAWLVALLGHGWLGVDLFFVLSGFLISGILLDSRNHPKYFQRFYGRRAVRILPVYFASVCVAAWWYPNSGKFFLLSAFFLANCAGLWAIQVPHGPGVLWSLAVEEHFYIVWPWLVRSFTRRKLALVAAAIVGITPILRGIAAARHVPVDMVIYQISVFRFDGLALGALLAIWWRSEEFTPNRSLRIIAALLAMDVLLTLAVIPFGGLGTATPAAVAIRFTQAQWVFAAGILAVLIFRGTAATAFFRSRFMTLSGELSYCIYLIHLSLADAYVAVVAPRLEPLITARAGPDAAMAVRVVIILVVTFALALLSRSFLERPFLNLKSRFG